MHNVHVVVFFIILVANIGGALTPLGDPPLFVGFLRGVDFFWTTQHLLAQTATRRRYSLLAIFVVIDGWLLPRGPPVTHGSATPDAAAARQRRHQSSC